MSKETASWLITTKTTRRDLGDEINQRRQARHHIRLFPLEINKHPIIGDNHTRTIDLINMSEHLLTKVREQNFLRGDLR